MSKKIVTQGNTTNEAIEKGLKELNATREMVDIKVLEEEAVGLKIIMADHLGADPLIASLISKRAKEAFQSMNDGDR